MQGIHEENCAFKEGAQNFSFTQVVVSSSTTLHDFAAEQVSLWIFCGVLRSTT